MKIVAKVATAPDLSDASVLDPILVLDGWQTLVAIVEDHGKSTYSLLTGYLYSRCVSLTPLPSFTETSHPPRPTTSAPQQPTMTDDGFVIPPDTFPSGSSAGPSGATSGGSVTCPHCTFENAAGSRDCEVCGLPLN